MGYVNIVRHPGPERPAFGVRDLGRMPRSPVGLLDAIPPDFIQELRVSDDEIWLHPAAERPSPRKTVSWYVPRPQHLPAPHHRARRAADPSHAAEVAR